MLILSSADFLNPVYQALPGHLASTDYQNPTDPCDTAVQRAFASKGKGLLQILVDRPGSAQGFGTLMSTWGEGNSLLQDIYDIQGLVDGFDLANQNVMFVDVGGGYGQKAISLKRSCPQLQGRFIVQDLLGTVENVPSGEGVEMMAYDFFTEQPIKGLLHVPSWIFHFTIPFRNSLLQLTKKNSFSLFISTNFIQELTCVRRSRLLHPSMST